MAYTTVEVHLEEHTSVYQVTDSMGESLNFEASMDDDGDYTVEIDGYVIDTEDYDLLQTLKLIDK